MAKRGRSKAGSTSKAWGAVEEWLGRSPKSRPRLLHRAFVILEDVLVYVRGGRCTPAEQQAFATLIMKLDANPLDSEVILTTANRPRPPGLRFATFGGHRLIFQFDPSRDAITLLACEPCPTV